MSIATIILGESGTGKSASLRNMSPADALLIQTVKKPMPFKAGGWQHRTPAHPTGNIFVADTKDVILSLMHKTSRKIIILDDWNLMMTNEFMYRSHENGFQKFSDIGKAAWEVMTAASNLPDDVRVYMLGHISIDEAGKTRAKTIGKLVDDKCPVESLFSIVMQTAVVNGGYYFTTRNSGSNTVKTPIGLFDDEVIENDLDAVDSKIAEYYGITKAVKPTKGE